MYTYGFVCVGVSALVMPIHAEFMYLLSYIHKLTVRLEMRLQWYEIV